MQVSNNEQNISNELAMLIGEIDTFLKVLMQVDKTNIQWIKSELKRLDLDDVLVDEKSFKGKMYNLFTKCDNMTFSNYLELQKK